MIRKLLIAGLIASASSRAIAADPGLPMQDPPSLFIWTGAYLGAHVGYAWGDSTYLEPSRPASMQYDPDGVLGGVYIGYNHQFDNAVVLGAEADIAFSDISGESPFYLRGGVQSPAGGTSELKWMASARARIGWSFDRFMPYFAGGVAFGRYEYDMFQTYQIGTLRLDNEETRTGWTLGGGADYAFTDNLILRGEYRYSDFGSRSSFYGTPSGPFPVDVDLRLHDFRAGIAYKF